MTRTRSRRTWPRVLARALGLGVLLMLILPVALAFGALAVAHLAGGCGAGSSGGCEMGAASLGLVALAPSFLIGAGLSLARDLRAPRP